MSNGDVKIFLSTCLVGIVFNLASTVASTLLSSQRAVLIRYFSEIGKGVAVLERSGHANPTVGQARAAAQEMAADPEVKALAEPHRPEKGDNITLPTKDRERGTSAAYVVRRLKRDAENADAPNREQAAAALRLLRTGEITSAREAARVGGIPVNERAVYLPADPKQSAQRLYDRFGKQWASALAFCALPRGCRVG